VCVESGARGDAKVSPTICQSDYRNRHKLTQVGGRAGGLIFEYIPLHLQGEVVACVHDQILCVFVAQVAGVAFSDFGDHVTGLQFALGGGASQRLQKTTGKN
jgi:hypothetical protein